jgi:hypothetical protein
LTFLFSARCLFGVRQNPALEIADFGCGEARLAASVNNRVHSFDLVAQNERVIAADMANVRGFTFVQMCL